jgi:hypothetical protein
MRVQRHLEGRSFSNYHELREQTRSTGDARPAGPLGTPSSNGDLKAWIRLQLLVISIGSAVDRAPLIGPSV